MSLADIVSVSITRVSSAVTQQGFSTALILAHHTRWTSDRVRSYASLSELTDDGFTPDDAVYKAAAALWSQPSPPDTIKVGRRASAFTQTVRLTPTEANSTVYAVELNGLEASYTSDASATVAEIVTGLAAAINALADADAIIATGASSASPQTLSGASLDGATGYRALSPSRRLSFTFSAHADWDATTITVTGKDAGGNTITETFAVPNGGGSTVNGSKLFARVTSVAIPAQSGVGGTFTMGVAAPMTATDDTTHVTLTSPAGLLASIELTGSGVIDLDDRTADPGIAADFATCREEDDDFYAVLLDSNSRAEILALAAVIETTEKVLLAQSADSGCFDGDTITDVAYLVKDAGYFRTHVELHPTVALNWQAAALAGSIFGYAPGTVTANLRELVGISSYRLTGAQRTAALAKNATIVETVAGRKVTVGGKVAGGEWLDVIIGLDWLRARIRERVFGALVSATDAKIPYTDPGIEVIHAQLRAQLQEAEDAGVLASGWTTNVPRAVDVSSAVKATRVLGSVTFRADLAGAIHAVNITGKVAA